jgi:hypothetical protein
MYALRIIGGVCRAVVVVSTVLGVAMVSVGAAGADGPVQLRSRLGDFCLDAPLGNMQVSMVINPCNGTDFQRWNPMASSLRAWRSPGSA